MKQVERFCQIWLDLKKHMAEKDVTIVEVIQEASSHRIQGTSDSLNSDLSILEDMVKIGELLDPRWVQPSV